jgi:CRISPR-associated protein Csb2
LCTARHRKLAEKRNKAADKGKATDKVKLTKKDLENLDDSLPGDVFAALHAESGELRKAGWNRPPGSEWINYVRKQTAPVAAVPSEYHIEATPRTVARYAVAGAVRPRLTETLWI